MKTGIIAINLVLQYVFLSTQNSTIGMPVNQDTKKIQITPCANTSATGKKIPTVPTVSATKDTSSSKKRLAETGANGHLARPSASPMRMSRTGISTMTFLMKSGMNGPMTVTETLPPEQPWA